MEKFDYPSFNPKSCLQGHLVQRKTNKTLTETDYIRFEYAHEAYITREEYDKIVPERT